MKVEWFQEYFICDYKKFLKIIFKFFSKNFFCYCYKILEICFFMSFLVVGGLAKTMSFNKPHEKIYTMINRGNIMVVIYIGPLF